MTWQESLRQLDARLASGDISANEYRKTRDEILAEASSSSPQRSGEDLWTSVPPEETGEQDAGETTHVVKVDTYEEETQVVPADAITPPPVPAQQQGPSAQAPGVRTNPYRATPIQGHEVFAEASPKQGGKILRFLVPLLILAVVGAGVWWFALRGGEENAAATPPPTSTAQETHGTDEVANLLPELPGKANANNGTLPLARARELKLFTPDYAKLLADNGVGDVVYRGAVRQGVAYLLVASPVKPAEDVDEVVKLTTAHLGRVGFAPAAGATAEPTVITRTDKAFRTFIAVYSAGDVWVQLNVSGPPDGDERELRTEFQKILGSLTERLPAD